MISLEGWLTIFNFIILIAGSIGGALVFRSSLAHAEKDVQERVRNALHDENELLQARVARVEKENRRLNSLLQLVVVTLKKSHSIDLEIDGDIVSLRDASGRHTARSIKSDSDAS